MSRDPGCLFCKIADGQIPASRILETPGAVAFLDINPVNPGHTLVIPRDHHATLSELPEELAAETAVLLPPICRAIREATGAEGLNVIVNHGEVAGQTIHHVHWHIIPRHRGDAVHWPWPHQAYGEGELAQIHERIRDALEAPSGS